MRSFLLSALIACSGSPPVTPSPDGSSVLPVLGLGSAGLPTVVVEIDPPSGNRDLVARASASDPEGRPVSLTWAWTRDGQPTAFDTDRVPATDVLPGQRWEVTATPRAAGLTGAPASAAVDVPEPTGDDVLVVVLDDFGVDKSNAFGLAPIPQRTPTLDSLASEGVLFRNAYATPLCSSSRVEILTGRFSRRSGIGSLIGDGGTNELSLEAITLPEALVAARGGTYASVATGKWHLASPLSASGPLSPNLQGFSSYQGSNSNLPQVPKGYFDWDKVTNGVTQPTTVYATTDTVDDALARIAELPEPWFVYLAFNAPHTPFHVPPADLVTVAVTLDSRPADLYGAALEAADSELGRLLATVDPGVLGRTTLLVLGDNGTTDPAVLPPFDSARAKSTVFQTGTRVPLIAVGPRVAAPGTTCDAFVQAVDVFATVADLAGVPLTGDSTALSVTTADGGLRRIDGISLLPWLADPSLPSARQYAFTERFGPIGPPPYAVRDDAMIRDVDFELVHQLVPIEDYDDLEFFDLRGQAIDEGPDLLPGGLTAEQQAAFDRLLAALGAQLDALPYDGY